MSNKAALFSSNVETVSTSFIISVKTDNTGTSNNDQFTIPTTGAGYSYNIDTSEHSLTGQTGSVTLTFASAGTYDVEISGTFPRVFFANGGDKDKLLDIKNWGNIGWSSMQQAFHGCINISAITAPDDPDLSNVTIMSQMFRGSGFNQDIGSWDVSGVLNMGFLFRDTPFNQDIGSWDVSSATDTSYMFRGTPFNQDIGSWDVSGVTTMTQMFFESDFNQDIGSWDVSGVLNMRSMFRGSVFDQDIGSWDVSAVTDMRTMFSESDFNQDIGSWDVSAVLTMNQMFKDTPFDQDISGWDINQVTDFGSFAVLSTFSTANYDAILIAWDAQGVMSYSGTVDFGGSKYTSGGAAETARTSLISKWGGITDGGAA